MFQHISKSKLKLTVLGLLLAACSNVAFAQEKSEEKPQLAQTETAKVTEDQTQLIRQITAETYEQMHDGWSSDELVLQDELNQRFLAQCELAAAKSKQIPNSLEIDWNWTLLNLRKAGKLKSKATKRNTIDLSEVTHVAEIVSRSLTDQHECSIDRLICDASLRNEFDKAAQAFDAQIDCYAVRKAAFQLRKARKLKPELISRIVDWGRSIENYSVKEIREQPELLKEHPGIYIFSDSSGYLYIGQTDNLRERLRKHLDESHNLSLAKYLKTDLAESISIEVHDFDPKSQASKTRHRRAYESELIANRKPRFNVQP